MVVFERSYLVPHSWKVSWPGLNWFRSLDRGVSVLVVGFPPRLFNVKKPRLIRVKIFWQFFVSFSLISFNYIFVLKVLRSPLFLTKELLNLRVFDTILIYIHSYYSKRSLIISFLVKSAVSLFTSGVCLYPLLLLLLLFLFSPTL